MKTKHQSKNKHQHKKDSTLPEDNSSVARFVDEGNPDSQIKHTQEEWGEDSDQPIPDGDKP
jgi:hypothetical protein